MTIELYKGSTRLCTISSSTSNDGSYSWSVDDCDGGTGDDYRIKVTSTSSSDYDYSGYFTIVAHQCLMSVTSPVSGTTWTEGDSRTITWGTSMSGICGSYVSLELYKMSSRQCTITSSTSEDGSYTWTVDDCGGGEGSDYRIKLTSISTGVSVYSSWFTISIPDPVPGAPSLLYPDNYAQTGYDVPRLDWSDPTYAYRYELMVDNNSSFSSPEVHETNLSVSYYTKPNTRYAEGTYYWKVRARNSSGTWGNWSSTRRFYVDWESTVEIVFDSIHVFSDGDATGNGELFWDFEIGYPNNAWYMLSRRLRDNPLSVASGQTYVINRSYDWEEYNVDGNYISVKFAFREADAIDDEYLGQHHVSYIYDLDSDSWETGSFSKDLASSEASIRVFWTVRRLN